MWLVVSYSWDVSVCALGLDHVHFRERFQFCFAIMWFWFIKDEINSESMNNVSTIYSRCSVIMQFTHEVWMEIKCNFLVFTTRNCFVCKTNEFVQFLNNNKKVCPFFSLTALNWYLKKKKNYIESFNENMNEWDREKAKQL